jgi:FkbM family methyltransferase
LDFLQQIIRMAGMMGKLQRKLALSLSGISLESAFRQGLGCVLGGKRLVAFDIGGAVGLQPHWEKLKGNGEFFVFEPHPQSYQEVKALYASPPFGEYFHVYPYALGGSSGKRKLYLTNVPTGSSLNPVNSSSRYIAKDNNYFYPVREETVDTKCLADFLLQEKLDPVDMIKLDVQSAEQEILEGLGAEHLSKLLCVELEVPMHDFYLNGTTVDGIWRFFRNHDFEVYDIRVARAYIDTEANRTAKKELLLGKSWDPAVSARAWELEMIAFKNPLPLLEKKDILSLRKLAGALCVYNFFLEALEILQLMNDHKLLSKDEHAVVSAEITKMRSIMGIETAGYRRLMTAGDKRNWAQYIWMTLPST